MVTEFLYGGLDLYAELRLSDHVRHCIGCSRHLRHVQRTTRALRDLSPEQRQLSPATRAHLLASFSSSVADNH